MNIGLKQHCHVPIVRLDFPPVFLDTQVYSGDKSSSLWQFFPAFELDHKSISVFVLACFLGCIPRTDGAIHSGFRAKALITAPFSGFVPGKVSL